MTASAMDWAAERYAALGVDVNTAMERLDTVPVSLHCWQGDDVGGFENDSGELGGGLAVTGNYPGKARSLEELRQDLGAVLTMLPGAHRLNLHASYGDFSDGLVERDELTVKQFESWIEWCRESGVGLDFNPTCFAHAKAEDGFTLASADEGIRSFWIEHVKRTREIASAMGETLNSPCINNIWIPDGWKDVPADRWAPRERLASALDEALAAEFPAKTLRDAVESKLFGIGSESYVVGSHEFYLGYAISRKTWLCLDAGHFHPTEGIAEKLSAVLPFVPGVLLHVSRGVRWDSDHVVLFDDATKAVGEEIVSGAALDRVALGLDFFDASINRVGAWALGARSARKALLHGLLVPWDALRAAESAGDLTARLALWEEVRTLPFGAVWETFCERHDCPTDAALRGVVADYEARVLSLRD